jgi:hypothetical protein
MTATSESLSQQASDGGDSWPGKRSPSKYVVRLSGEERAQLDELISKGKRSAQQLTKARILLKADVSDAGEGWSDSRIAAAFSGVYAATPVGTIPGLSVDFYFLGLDRNNAVLDAGTANEHRYSVGSRLLGRRVRSTVTAGLNFI